MACFTIPAIKRHLSAVLTAIFERYSPLSKVLDAPISPTSPDWIPSFLLISTRSRSVRLPAVSRFNLVSVVTDLDIQTQEFLHEEDGATPPNRFEIFSNLCVFQVCGLFMSPSLFLFNFLWFFLVISLLCCYNRDSLMSLFLGLPPCYVFDYCSSHCCLSWFFNPKSGMDALCRIAGKGLLGVVVLTSELEGLDFVFPVDLPLNPGRSSIFFCFNLVLVLPNAEYLVGNLAIKWPSSFGLRLLNDWGKCLFYCFSLAILIWICALSSTLLTLVECIALVRCAHVHVWLGHVFADIRDASQAQEMGKKGKLHSSMRISFL